MSTRTSVLLVLVVALGVLVHRRTAAYPTCNSKEPLQNNCGTPDHCDERSTESQCIQTHASYFEDFDGTECISADDEHYCSKVGLMKCTCQWTCVWSEELEECQKQDPVMNPEFPSNQVCYKQDRFLPSSCTPPGT